MPIRCCKGCVAPKRHLGCHDTCSEYQEELAIHIAAKKRGYPEVASTYTVELTRIKQNKTIMHRKRRGRVY